MTLMTASMILLADIFMMGDSTMCDYKPGSYPQEGWGRRLRTFTKDGVRVHNRAVGGMSDITAKNAKDGFILAAFRTGTVPGEAKITITPEGLKPVELKVSIANH